VLVAGELVTVTGDRFDDDQRKQLWVVVDALARVYRLAGQVLRVRVHRRPEPEQSSAEALVLNPTGGFTRVAVTPPADWHAATPSSAEAASCCTRSPSSYCSGRPGSSPRRRTRPRPRPTAEPARSTRAERTGSARAELNARAVAARTLVTTDPTFGAHVNANPAHRIQPGTPGRPDLPAARTAARTPEPSRNGTELA
jgi:hypothetical protein